MRAWWIGLFVACLVSPAFAEGPDAATELHAAIDILKTRHMNRAKVDWPKVEAAAFEAAKSAKTAADAYPIIRDIIAQLGEKHTMLIGADSVKARQTGAKVGNAEPSPFNAPEAWSLKDGAVLLRLPGFMGTEADDRIYVATARQALNRQAERACRVVIDLRGNWGGNMYPMLNALKSLLGPTPYGYWMAAPGGKSTWSIPDHPIENGLAADYAVAAPPLMASVAVLVDRSTASSGEFTAMALQGLPRVKTFGVPTAGFLTANNPGLARWCGDSGFHDMGRRSLGPVVSRQDRARYRNRWRPADGRCRSGMAKGAALPLNFASRNTQC
jgi:hypothetical protein